MSVIIAAAAPVPMPEIGPLLGADFCGGSCPMFAPPAPAPPVVSDSADGGTITVEVGCCCPALWLEKLESLSLTVVVVRVGITELAAGALVEAGAWVVSGAAGAPDEGTSKTDEGSGGEDEASGLGVADTSGAGAAVCSAISELVTAAGASGGG